MPQRSSPGLLPGSVRKNANLPRIKRNEFNKAINSLVEMDCIELSGSTVWLREWVCIKY